MASSCYSDNTQSQSIAPTSHYSSYQIPKSSTENNDDDDDDDLEALRKAALKTLNFKKRKNNYDHNSRQSLSRSSSRSYTSSSSRSSSTHSSTSRSYSSISSQSSDNHDKDYRFETKDKRSTGDIDERFPEDIPHDNNMLIVNCPIQDDDLLLQNEQKSSTKIAKTFDHDERDRSKTKSRKNETKKSSSMDQPPVSITVKLNSNEFDLRQLIKKRRIDDKQSSEPTRVVQILPKDKELIVHKSIHDRLSSGRSSHKYNKH